mgnify:CR=1 FL=1
MDKQLPEAIDMDKSLNELGFVITLPSLASLITSSLSLLSANLSYRLELQI